MVKQAQTKKLIEKLEKKPLSLGRDLNPRQAAYKAATLPG